MVTAPPLQFVVCQPVTLHEVQNHALIIRLGNWAGSIRSYRIGLLVRTDGIVGDEFKLRTVIFI